jgi:hypothetical protein
MVEVPTTPPGGSSEFGPERRKNHRVQITIGVVIKSQAPGKPFEESTQTVVVNLNGCLVRMKTVVARNQELTMTNTATDESAAVRVSYIGRKDGDKTEIGLGFVKPEPKFWRISFPPENQDPTERKRFIPSGAPPAAPKKS